MKTTARFRVSRHPRFEDTKRIMSAKMRPKGFGPFGKQASVLNFSCLAKLLLLSSVQKLLNSLATQGHTFFTGIKSLIKRDNYRDKQHKPLASWLQWHQMNREEFPNQLAWCKEFLKTQSKDGPPLERLEIMGSEILKTS